MKTNIFIAGFLMVAAMAFSQGQIVLQDGDNIFVHNRLDTIMGRAKDGNFIYLPGGNIVLTTTLVINKSVHIYGAGHYPDSSAATSVTYISGSNIVIGEEGDGTTLTGFYFANEIALGTSTQDTVQFIDISRCNLANLRLGYTSGQRNSGQTNIRVAECVIRGVISGADAQFCLFENNIIEGSISYFTGNVSFVNNVFNYYYSAYDVFQSCTGIVVNNNIFARDSHGLTGSQLNNNIFTVNVVGAPGGTNIGDNNIGNQLLSDIFVNFDGSIFNYSLDYHLKEGSAGIGAATDGLDIGLYGGLNSYKPSAVPANPHIRYVNIPRQSTNGKLQVEVHAAAQDN